MQAEADSLDYAEYERRTDPLQVAMLAEKSALGGQLVFSDMLGAEWMPAPSDYSVPAHQMIAAAIAACAQVGAVDTVVIYTWLSERGEIDAAGGLTYINDVAQSVPSRAGIKTLAAIVRTKAQARREAGLRAQAAALLRGSSNTADVMPEVRALLDQVDGQAPASTAPRPRKLEFDQLAQHPAPVRPWFRTGWLGPGVTLFPGKGGEGKTTMAQHEATCGSLGRAYFTPASDPYQSMMWDCEGEHDDMWRLQERICDHEQIDMASLVGRLHLVSRYGCDNALMTDNRGTLVATRLLEELRQQVNDLGIEVLWLDNVAHLLVGNHDDRTHATQFINALNSLVVGRPFGVVLLAHVSRAQGSEFSGSAAWENAARMRWYLGPKLPDQPFDVAEDTGPTDVRYLCKRKSNYSARDYAKFTMRAGLMVPEHIDGDRTVGLMSAAEEARADQLCMAGFATLVGMGIQPSDKHNSGDYLPRQIIDKGLAPGYTKQDLARALNRLMTRGKFVRGVVGRYSNSNPKHGLQMVEGAE